MERAGSVVCLHFANVGFSRQIDAYAFFDIGTLPPDVPAPKRDAWAPLANERCAQAVRVTAGGVVSVEARQDPIRSGYNVDGTLVWLV